MAEPARSPKDEAPSPAQQPDKPGTPLFYSNALSLVVGLYDFTFFFGHRLGPDSEPSRDVAIVMSPEHAAAAQLVLTRYLDAYQQKFGKIRMPEELLTRLEKLETDTVEKKVGESHA
jgi:hypothetical protein